MRKANPSDPFDTTPGRRFHRPRFHHYVVATPGFRTAWNRSLGIKIGAAIVIRKRAYCLKWADSIPQPMVGSPGRD